MTDSKKETYITRDRILKMLSDDEIGRVGTAESAAHLSKGEEYLDLERLDRGVQAASGAGPAMGNVLPKKSVHASTWSSIVTQLNKPGNARAHVGA